VTKKKKFSGIDKQVGRSKDGRNFVEPTVKNTFGIVQINVFQLSVIYKSYREVLTPVNNSQLLLKLPITDKLQT